MLRQINEVRKNLDSIKNLVGIACGIPDISFNSASSTPVWVYVGTPPPPLKAAWLRVYGTSVAAPSLAAIVNAAGDFQGSTAAELRNIYSRDGSKNDFTDIIDGNCGLYGGYLARPGWDFCTGIGTVVGLGGK